jgi:phage terminase large subunit
MAVAQRNGRPGPGLKAQFPEAFAPLFEPHRYKVYWGGRGAAKSWAFARALLIQATKEPLRVLCCREVMRTISDSVHQLLVDQIKSLGLEAWFTPYEAYIEGRNGAMFTYAGLRQQDATKIKSYEGFDVAWVEEAHNVSKRSWDMLVPTIRADGSEIWVSFNPELDTDETYTRFVEDPPDDAAVRKVTYRDNPWFPAVLEKERLDMQRRSPDDYDHIWEGNPRTVVEGAIYGKEVMRMVQERRYGRVPYDPARPVHRIWDLGWNDAMAIICVQRSHSAVSIIDYRQDSFKTYAEWIGEFDKLPYSWGEDWLPHDGEHKEPRTGKSAKQWLRGLGCRRVKIIPKLRVEDGIRNARALFPRTYIDKTKAGGLMNCLKRYRRGVPESTGEPGAPVHDEYSHGADAFRGLAVCVDKISNEVDPRPRGIVVEFEPLDRGIGM